MSVFVTDGNHRATLAVVRALGLAGIPVTVGDTAKLSLAGVSRYSTSTVQYPSPIHDCAGFRTFLRQEVRTNRYAVLLPMTDITVTCVAEEAADLERFTSVPLPGAPVIRTAQDKAETLAIAKALGIPCPATMAGSDDPIQQALDELSFPMVVKARQSRLFQDGRWRYADVHYVNNEAELRQKYKAAHAEIPYPLIQERIEGEGCGVFLLVWNGEVQAAFAHRRIREKPPSGGVSVCCESTPCEPELLGQSAKLLKEIGWRGPAMVEFKRDRRDGVAKLMEINGRFWGSLQLAIDAGVNFPLLLYSLATGSPPSSVAEYQIGVRSRWLLGELDHLLMRLATRGDVDRATFPAVSKAAAIREFLKVNRHNEYCSDFRRDDLRPFAVECLRYAGKILARRPAPSPNHRSPAKQTAAVLGR